MRHAKITGKEIWIINYRYWIEEPSWYCCYDSLDALLCDFDTFVKDVLEVDEIILTDEEIEKYRELLKIKKPETKINIEGTDYYIWVETRPLWGLEE